MQNYSQTLSVKKLSDFTWYKNAILTMSIVKGGFQPTLLERKILGWTLSTSYRKGQK